MARVQKRFITRVAVLLLVLLLCRGDFSFSQQDRGKEYLETFFRWAAMDYQSGKYREAVESLHLLLSYFDERQVVGHSDIERVGNELPGKIYLLLGAAYERLGDIRRARKNYRLSLERVENPRIPGIDMGGLVEYQRIIMKKKKPVKRGIIEKPGPKPKKKRRSPVLIVAGVALTGTLVMLQLLSKKKGSGNGHNGSGAIPSFDTDRLGIQWIEVPAGQFVMGDNFNEGDPDELPLHTVSLDRYFISKFEVTFNQYDRFCEDTNRRKPEDNGWGRQYRPVINVTWGEAGGFCNWVAQKTGKNIHLPTEAQWEKAARGTDGRRYPWGNTPLSCLRANYNCSYRTFVVGSLPDGNSPYGVSDMAGNVAEWCLDAYNPTFYLISPGINPLSKLPEFTTATAFDFVIRGGSWDGSQPITARCADRWYGRYNKIRENLPEGMDPDTRSPDLGFRLVWEDSL